SRRRGRPASGSSATVSRTWRRGSLSSRRSWRVSPSATAIRIACSGPPSPFAPRPRSGATIRARAAPGGSTSAAASTGGEGRGGGAGRGISPACYNPLAEEEDDMAILKVARLGHPVLRKLAAPVPVRQIASADTQRLIDDMVATMREYNGAGLAAPQVH